MRSSSAANPERLGRSPLLSARRLAQSLAPDHESSSPLVAKPAESARTAPQRRMARAVLLPAICPLVPSARTVLMVSHCGVRSTTATVSAFIAKADPFSAFLAGRPRHRATRPLGHYDVAQWHHFELTNRIFCDFQPGFLFYSSLRGPPLPEAKMKFVILL